MDGSCFGIKVTAFVDREIAANPELVQIENGYRSPKEKRLGAVQRGHFREIDPRPTTPMLNPFRRANPRSPPSSSTQGTSAPASPLARMRTARYTTR